MNNIILIVVFYLNCRVLVNHFRLIDMPELSANAMQFLINN